MRRLATSLISLALLLGALPAGATVAARVESSGYIPLQDGTLLHYRLLLPSGKGPFPTLVAYTGYKTDLYIPADSIWTDPAEDRVGLAYARMNVTVRGAGCSGGSFELFSPQQAADGVEVLRWVEQQDWSRDDATALWGESYAAIMALLVAEQDGVEEHLDAVVAAHPMLDLYRDVLHPGGVPNVVVPTVFTGRQNFHSLEGIGTALDGTCAGHLAARGTSGAEQAAVIAALHPFDDELMRQRSPGERIRDIDVPVFTAIAWQDGTLGSRPADLLTQLDVPYRAIVGNGHHQLWYAGWDEVLEFLDLHLYGVGSAPVDPITVWWEKADGPGWGRGPTAWETGLGAWPPPQARTERYALAEGGRLVRGTGTGGPDRYVTGAPGQSQATEHTWTGYAQQPPTGANDWSRRPVTGTALAYTTDPFEGDVTVLGNASVDLWLSSTAPDTDLQVTLTEVRPNGEEVYVQQGWLRASHRALDEERSTPTRPFHTHRRDDRELLVPGAATPLRIEVLPFGHVFRAGSSLRLWVESPKITPDVWAFAPTPLPAVNAIHHDEDHPSTLVLSVVPGQRAKAAPPACASPALRQPCR